jgi:hypothetical protein
MEIYMGRMSGVAAAIEALNFGKLNVVSNLVTALEWHALFVESVTVEWLKLISTLKTGNTFVHCLC